MLEVIESFLKFACLKAGAVKEGTAITQLPAINGPGMCGADYPLKVASLGESAVPAGGILSFSFDVSELGNIVQIDAALHQLVESFFVK